MKEKTNNTRTKAIAAVAAIMLVAATVISLAATENAFAYNKNQAASQANDCGNGEVPIDVFCQNLASQIQGDHNTVGIAASQGFEEIGPPPPPAETCDECFEPLSQTQIDAFLDNIGFTSIEAFCSALEGGDLTIGDVASNAAQAGILGTTLANFIDCIRDFLP
jgi:hypothetical protein